MERDLMYLLFGYLSGSVLYARLNARLFDRDILGSADDHNPGTANAFVYGGFWCGLLTLLGDLMKGLLPVALYLRGLPNGLPTLLTPLILCAPVAGHVFPVTYAFRGGKGIATTFGCLLGLWPYGMPVMTLAAVFLFYSLILRISPNRLRTAATYLTWPLCLLAMRVPRWICFAVLCMSGMVLHRLHTSPEAKQKPTVRLLGREW